MPAPLCKDSKGVARPQVSNYAPKDDCVPQRMVPSTQTLFLNPLGVGTAEVNIIEELSGESDLLVRIRRHREVVPVSRFLVGVVSLVRNVSADASLIDACSIEAPEGVDVALPRAQNLHKGTVITQQRLHCDGAAVAPTTTRKAKCKGTLVARGIGEADSLQLSITMHLAYAQRR